MKKYVLFLTLPFALLAWIFASGFAQPESLMGDVEEILPEIKAQNFNIHSNRLFLKGEAYSGWVEKKYADGSIKSRTPYLDGIKNGWIRTWFGAGQLKSERLYVNGKKEGIHLGWWPNGCSRFMGHFENGLTEGEFLEWYYDGRLFRRFHYVSGKENGRQQAWKSDGRIKANYVMKEGRRYGLFGVKGCDLVEKK